MVAVSSTMVWAYSVCCVYLAAASAYNYNFYPSYTPSHYRRIDEGPDLGMADSYQSRSNDRQANERSIPYKSEAQRVHQRDRIRHADEAQLRHGNTTYKFGNGNKNFPTIANRRGTPDLDSAVVFPGPTSRSSQFVPEIPKECEELGICEDIPNYPHDYVDNLITQVGDAKYRFNLDVITPEIAQRRGPEQDQLELCQYNEKVVYPSAAKNINGQWVIIINGKQHKVQGFKTEICKANKEPCNNLIYTLGPYRHECGQKMAVRSMWSVDAEGNMVLESVPMASCCTCFIKNAL